MAPFGVASHSCSSAYRAFLYENLQTWVVFNGEVVAQVDMTCGVKKGCPLSGTLFALCVDGLLRRMCVVPPRRRRVFAYADDLATIVRCLFAELGPLLQLFVRWRRVSGLQLRLDKSVVVWLGPGVLSEVQTRLWGDVPEARAGSTYSGMLSIWGSCSDPRLPETSGPQSKLVWSRVRPRFFEAGAACRRG